ncbi:MAG: 4Fe-4S dicluster domain-containing protein [Candidatus Hodarchaeota archaeon]
MTESMEEVIHSLRLCYQCGTCSGGCPVFRADSEKNPRVLIEKMLLGQDIEKLLEDDRIWYCSLCYTCTARCPQGVDLAHALVELKNMAVNLKNAPKGIIAEVKAILEKGYTAEVSKAIVSKREKMGLMPELPKANQDEISKLLDKTGVVESINQLLKAVPEEEAV